MRKLFLVACIASVALAAPAAGWADDCFLYLTSVSGNQSPSGAPFGPCTIELLGWSWGGAVDLQSPASTGVGRPPVPEFRFLKRFDATSSVDLQKFRHSGAPVLGGILQCYMVYDHRGGGNYLKLEFNDVRVLEIQTRYVPGQNPPTPVEAVAIGFSTILVNAFPIRPDGKFGPQVLFGWDYRNNRPIERSPGGGTGTWGTGNCPGGVGTGQAPAVVAPVQSPVKVIPPPTTPQPIKK